MNKEAISSFGVPCEGVSKIRMTPLVDKPAHPTITVYTDGSREVGCPYLDGQICRADPVVEYLSPCVQLSPVFAPKVDFRLNQRGSRKASPVTLNITAIEERSRKLDMSQVAIARSIERSQSFISNMFKGKHMSSGASVDAAYRLSLALDMPLEIILTKPEDVERVGRYKELIEAAIHPTTGRSPELDTFLENLPLKLSNIIKRHGVKTIDELRGYMRGRKPEILRWRQFGKKNFDELKEKLDSLHPDR